MVKNAAASFVAAVTEHPRLHVMTGNRSSSGTTATLMND